MMHGPAEDREVAAWVVQTLRARGHTAYFAGGCVRDELLGIMPQDYDVATSALPDEIVKEFPRTAQVGAAFGVVLVHHRGVNVEVATFRSDGPYSDKRRPDTVTFADAVADAERRDFTINAMFLDPLKPASDSTRIIDHVGGLQDLHARVLRAVGDPDQRLAEDHLRALRAVRLATRLGFKLDEATAAAIRRHAQDLRGVSRERIGDEIRLMLVREPRADSMELLFELGLDEPTFGRAHHAPSQRPLYPHLAAFRIESAGGIAQSPFAGALAATLLDRAGASLLDESGNGGAGEGRRLDEMRRVREALCLSNDERDECLAVLRVLATLRASWSALPVARQKRLAASTGFSSALAIVRATDPSYAELIVDRVRALALTFGGLCPTPLLTGDDLVGAGFQPGPAFRIILDGVYDAQLEGRIAKAADAMTLAHTLATRLAGGSSPG